MYVKGIRKLFEFRGYVVESIALDWEVGQVRLRRDKRLGLRCSACGGCLWKVRELWQSAWDLPLGTALFVRIIYQAIQGWCVECRRHETIRPEGIDERMRSTRRLMEFVSQLCRYTPVDAVPTIVPVPRSTVHRWDKKILSETLPEPNLENLRILLIDEKAIGKRHRYVTLVMNGETGELLHMATGKKKQSLLEFLRKLTEDQKAGIQAVALDRHGAYYEAVREELPHVAIVFDKFHLVMNYNAVIDEVRRTEWRKAKAEDKTVIKGQRYNLFRNSTNLTPEQRHSLKHLLAVNEKLSAVYVLKDALKTLWTYTYPACAAKYLDRWVTWAKETGIHALTRFANGLHKAKEEILNYCHFRISTGRLEAFNAIVGRIIFRSCGVKDLDYLFLKLRQETLS